MFPQGGWHLFALCACHNLKHGDMIDLVSYQLTGRCFTSNRPRQIAAGHMCMYCPAPWLTSVPWRLPMALRRLHYRGSVCFLLQSLRWAKSPQHGLLSVSLNAFMSKWRVCYAAGGTGMELSMHRSMSCHSYSLIQVLRLPISAIQMQLLRMWNFKMCQLNGPYWLVSLKQLMNTCLQ